LPSGDRTPALFSAEAFELVSEQEPVNVYPRRVCRNAAIVVPHSLTFARVVRLLFALSGATPIYCIRDVAILKTLSLAYVVCTLVFEPAQFDEPAGTGIDDGSDAARLGGMREQEVCFYMAILAVKKPC